MGLVVDDLVLEVEVQDEAEREYATSRAEQLASLAFPVLDEVQEARRKAVRLPLLVRGATSKTPHDRKIYTC